MNINEAISGRRSVRDYTTQRVDEDSIHLLLDAAVHAPTAMHEEPWAFAVIQNKSLLNHLSDHVKELLVDQGDLIHSHGANHASNYFISPEFNAFYNALTLIIIYGKPMGVFVGADCWLAAQNLMLTAFSRGLGTCVIGLAVTALNTPKWKKELGIAADMTAYAPIIVGVPASENPPTARKPPEILIWK